MKKVIKPSDNSANQQNGNRGTLGTNRQFDQAQGNRGKQLNPNQKGSKQIGLSPKGKGKK
jgi:hypothetical protein